MLGETGQAITFEFYFEASADGTGKTGLTVTVDVWAPDGSALVTNGAATAIGGGFYTYTVAAGSVTAAGNYRAVGKTTDATVRSKHCPSLWVVGKPWVQRVNTGVPNVAPGSSGGVYVIGGTGVAVASIGNNVLTAAAIAAGALNGKGDWLTTLGANAPAGWFNAAAIGSGFLAAFATADTGETSAAPRSVAQLAQGGSGGGAGEGDIAVNHNTGGTDALRVTAGGVGVDDVRIRAYLTSDYDAGFRVARGEAFTASDGRWVSDMMLDAGSYTLTFDKPGYVLKNQEVTVAS